MDTTNIPGCSGAGASVSAVRYDMLAATPPEKDVYPEFMRFLGDAARGKVYLCAHNASFDFGFLEKTLKRLEIGAELHYVDTLALCRKNIRGLENYKQDTIEEHFGLVNTQSHRALKECYLIKR